MNNLVQKIVLFSFATIMLVYGFLFAIGTSSITKAADLFFFEKEFVERPIVRAIAKILSDKINNKITDTVLGLGEEGPQYITDWRKEILGTESRGNDVFRTILANTQLCAHLDGAIKQAFLADKYSSGKTPTFDFFTCTQTKDLNTCIKEGEDFAKKNTGSSGSSGGGNVSSVLSIVNQFVPAGTIPLNLRLQCPFENGFDLEAFKQDFTKGGFDAWLKVTDYNPARVVSDVLSEQSKQLARTKDAEDQERLTSDGLISTRPKGETTSDQDEADGACFIGCVADGFPQSFCEAVKCNSASQPSGAFGRTVIPEDIGTPANLIAQTLGGSLGSNIDRLVQAREWVDLVTALISIVGDQLKNFGAGNKHSESAQVISNRAQYNQTAPINGAPDSDLSSNLNACLTQCDQSSVAQCTSRQQDKAQCELNARSICYRNCQNTTTGTDARILPGTTCTNDSVCGSSLICSATQKICVECESDTECANGRTCDQGICKAATGNAQGESCLNDNHCQTGFFCNSNKRCRPKDGGTPPTIGNISIALSDSDGIISISQKESITARISNLPLNTSGYVRFYEEDLDIERKINFATDGSTNQTKEFTFTPETGEAGLWIVGVYINNQEVESEDFEVEE